MGILDKIFGKKREMTDAQRADLIRQNTKVSMGAIQSDEEVASVRRTMEAEMDAAKARRNEPKA